MPSNFADRLASACAQRGNPCLVGIDPHIELLPEEFAEVRDARRPRAERARRLGDFCCEVIDVVAGRVPAIKPQSAFFEVFGADGVAAWERVVRAARAADLLVIGDVKRGDIASTASAYATAFLEGTSSADRDTLCDAVTLNPFLGADSISPFVEVCARTGTGLFVLVRTSNKGSADFQRHGSPELSYVIAERVVSWGAPLTGESGWSSVGAVVGATHGSELRRFRECMPRSPFLLPGFGAQGANASDVAHAFVDAGSGRWGGALVNSSRGITFANREAAHRGKPWKDATRDALDAMIRDIRGALSSSR
jgi:orotidine-5'-phosphate decarboxylase